MSFLFKILFRLIVFYLVLHYESLATMCRVEFLCLLLLPSLGIMINHIEFSSLDFDVTVKYNTWICTLSDTGYF